MKRTALLSAACLSLLLAGCASAATPNADPVTVSPAASSSATSSPSAEVSAGSASETAAGTSTAPSTTAAAEPKRSERGNLIKVPGQAAGILNDAGEDIITFTVHSIKSDFRCTDQFKQKPENGHFIALDVSAVTKKGVKDVYYGDWMMNQNDFKTIAPNGTTSNANLSTGPAYTCVRSSEMLPEMGDNEKARGLVILDAENAEGTLVYQDSFTSAGWEWEYPAK